VLLTLDFDINKPTVYDIVLHLLEVVGDECVPDHYNSSFYTAEYLSAVVLQGVLHFVYRRLLVAASVLSLTPLHYTEDPFVSSLLDMGGATSKHDLQECLRGIWTDVCDLHNSLLTIIVKWYS
jgi:hypothetical protein